MSYLRLYSALKLSLEHKIAREDLLPNVFTVRMIDFPYVRWTKSKKFGGTINCGDSYLELIFCHWKDFKVLAKLLDAAGAMQSQSSKRPGYRYMIG